MAAVAAACEMSAKGEALMSLSPRKTGPVVLMLFLAHLFTPAVQALPPSGWVTSLESEGFLPATWEWLMSLVSRGETGLQRNWEKAGSSMDPDGCPQDSASTISKAGSSMDPDGDK